MKILKIFGVVVGIHVFALILIFANPGCSSTTKPAPSVADTAPIPPPAPTITVPLAGQGDAPSSTSAIIAFNPDAPATAPMVSASGLRTVPTRPDTPVAGLLVAQPVGDVTPAATYVVKSGDNLSTIAKKNNLPVPQLIAANNGLTANSILRPGQKLIIPSKAVSPTAGSVATAKAADAASVAATISSARPTDVVKHTVKSGDTLGGIARNYGVKQGDIAVANNISDPAKIRPGMELVIPGWQPKGDKSGKAPGKAGSGSPKGGEMKAPFTLGAPGVTEIPPAVTPPPVPVIRLDEGTATPAPKN